MEEWEELRKIIDIDNMKKELGNDLPEFVKTYELMFEELKVYVAQKRASVVKNCIESAIYFCGDSDRLDDYKRFVNEKYGIKE